MLFGAPILAIVIVPDYPGLPREHVCMYKQLTHALISRSAMVVQ